MIYLIIWIILGIIAIVIAGGITYRQTQQRKEDFVVELVDVALVVLGVVLGPISLLITIAYILDTYPDTPVFTIKYKDKNEKS